jgi:hypothetical protein
MSAPADTPGFPAPDRAPARILFIGNSFTSRHGLPSLLAALAAAAGQGEVVTECIVAGGASLRRHWNAGVARERIASAPWDYVVLQEQSTLPVKSPKRYHENVRLFTAEIAKHPARIALYLTWARQDAAHAQPEITAAVEAIAAEVGASIVPVGTVWHSLLRDDPQLALYADDGRHPTAAGSYLAACTFLVSLFGRAPGGWSVSDRLKIERAVAGRLHDAAWASHRPSDPHPVRLA